MTLKLEKVLTVALVALTVAFCILNVLSFSVSAGPELSIQNLDTGIGYETIHEAVNASETLNGHTIQVGSGIYHEHLVINKSITLVGENKLDTVIDGDGNVTIIEVITNNVSISGFTLQNTATAYGAIRLETSEGHIITNNIIKNAYYGINSQNSHNNSIVNNQFVNNTYSGAYFVYSTKNTVSSCSFSNNVHAGVFLFNSSNNQVHNCTISGHKFGVNVVDSDGNVVFGNRVSSSESGIRLTGSQNNLVFGNRVSSSESGIRLTGSHKNTVSNNTVSLNNKNGVLLDSSNNNVVLNNTAQGNGNAGVHLTFSSNNRLLFNNLSTNQYGIQLADSDNCTINENTAINNTHGIALSMCAGNSFWGNNFQADQYGIHFDNSDNNTIFNNNFNNNTQPLSSINSTNYLDNGAEGNYWSNYNGTDADQDAIGDTPHILDQNHTDNYPLMGKFFHFVIHVEEETYHISIISNSTVSKFQFNETTDIINFNVTGSGTEGFCRLRTPKNLITSSHVIVVDDKKVNATALPVSNTTHRTVYFTYAFPAHQIMIVSEPYYNLLEKYNTLLAEYQNLNSTYNDLLEAYGTLFANFTQLQSNYENLNMTFHQLIDNYDSLQDSYNTLLAQNESLTSTYNNLLASYEDLQSKYNTAINEINNTRNLVYVLTATVIGVAAILFSINIKFRQKISEQDKIIQAYNPLEIARILFMDDVEKRGSKIEEFEKKHGIKIRPRNTLEDVLKDLEKKEKKS